MIQNKRMLKNMFPNQPLEYLLDYLWIVEKKSGICIFQKCYYPTANYTKLSPDIISGFFTAFSIFIDEAFSDDLKQVEFKGKAGFLTNTGLVIFFPSCPHHCLETPTDMVPYFGLLDSSNEKIP